MTGHPSTTDGDLYVAGSGIARLNVTTGNVSEVRWGADVEHGPWLGSYRVAALDDAGRIHTWWRSNLSPAGTSQVLEDDVVAIDSTGRTAVVLTQTGSLLRLDPVHATEVWNATFRGPPGEDEVRRYGPLTLQGYLGPSVLLSGEESVVVAERGTRLAGFDADGGGNLWSRTLADSPYAPALLERNSPPAVVVAANRTVRAIAMHNGSTVWNETLEHPVATDPVSGGESVYVGTTHGELLRIGGDRGNVTWRLDLNRTDRFEFALNAPVGLSGCQTSCPREPGILVGSGSLLQAFRVGNGVEWVRTDVGLKRAGLLTVKSDLYVMGVDEGITRLDSSTGETVWHQSISRCIGCDRYGSADPVPGLLIAGALVVTGAALVAGTIAKFQGGKGP